MFFVPPALHQSTQPLHALLEALEALPEAITDHRAARVPAAARKAGAEWERGKATLLPKLAPADQARVRTAMDGIHGSDSRAAALSALDASDALLSLVPEGRARELRRADQDGMRAWMLAEAGRWDAVPDLNASFAWLLAHDEGRHTPAVREVQTALKAFTAARSAKDRAHALREAQRLLDLVDILER